MADHHQLDNITWLRWEKCFFVAASVVTALVAMIAEAGNSFIEFSIGLLLVCISTVTICSWALFGTPGVGFSAIIVACSMLSLGWSVDDPETALFQLVLIATAVGMRVQKLYHSLMLMMLLVSLPVIGTLGPNGADWGWWNWSTAALLTWGIGRLIMALRVTLDELVAARSQLIDSASRAERLRISNDVHDLVGHSLTAMLLNIRAAQRTLDSNVQVAKSALADAEQVGITGLTDIRGVLIDLRKKPAAVLSSPPDGEAILYLLDQHSDISIHTDAKVASIQGQLAVSLYRIVQECITNILKHAVPGTARISVVHIDDAIVLESSNSTKAGHRPGKVPSESSIGLISMQERVSSLGGTFTSEIRNGQWRIHCWIPVNA